MACLNNKCCGWFRNCFGFNYCTYTTILMLFFVGMTIMTSVQTNNHYNSSHQEEWILVGGLGSTNATFRVRAHEMANQRTLVVSKSSNFEGAAYEMLVSEGENADSMVQTHNVPNLESNTKYYYAMRDEDLNVRKQGTFSTPGIEGERFDFKIAAAGCAWTGSKVDVFRKIKQQEPLFFVHLGDFHYEDIAEDNFELRIRAIDKVLGSPSQEELFSSTGLVYIWDDHDWLGDESNSLGEGRESGLKTYRVGFPYYSPLPAQLTSPTGEEVSPYHAFTVGTVRFIVMDLRSEATETSIYSNEQREWLYGEILGAENYDFVVLVSSKPWIGDPTEDDSWFGFPEDRADLSNFITETVGAPDGPQNLLMISADAHMVAFDHGANTYYGNRTDNPLSFPILQTGPMDRLGSAKGTAFSMLCHTVRWERNHQYSTIEFQMSGDNGEPCIEIRSFRYPEKGLLTTRLCGKIFTSIESAGEGSCDATSLTTGSYVVLGVTGGLLVMITVVSCWFMNWRRGLAIFLITFICSAATILVGFGIPTARNVAQFDTYSILVMAMCQMIVAFFFVLVWIMVYQSQEKKMAET